MWLLWMLACSTSAIVDGTQTGPLVQVKDFFTSSFLLETDEGAVLFDAGFAESARPLERALEDRGLGLDDVTDVFLSHGHTDHVAGLPALSSARVWSPEAEWALIAEEGPEGAGATDVISDGDTLDRGAHTIEALAVPGHTPGSMVYLVDDVLVMGDAAVATTQGALEPPPEGYSDDPDAAASVLVELAERVADREVSWLVFSHTGPLEGQQALQEFRPEAR